MRTPSRMSNIYSKSPAGKAEKGPAARKGRLALPWAVTSLLATPQASALTLITTDAAWRFQRGTNEASLPDTTAWRFLGFEDAHWAESPAMFYYGKTGFAGTELADMRRTDTQAGYTCIYLRKTFFIT